MKILLLLLLMTGFARADVYVVTAPDNSVYSLSELDDAVVPQGYKKNIIKGSIENLPISGGVQLYDFKNGQFIINANKVAEKNKIDQSAILEEQTLESNKVNALAKLTDAITKVEPKDVLTDDEIKALLGK